MKTKTKVLIFGAIMMSTACGLAFYWNELRVLAIIALFVYSNNIGIVPKT